MRLSANFTLAEFTKSQTATRKGLDNTPGEEHLANAKELFANVVQKVRENFGVTVINSGYRGPALNEAVGGSSKSQHCKGEAVDIECPGTGNYDVAKWISQSPEFSPLCARTDFWSLRRPFGHVKWFQTPSTCIFAMLQNLSSSRSPDLCHALS